MPVLWFGDRGQSWAHGEAAAAIAAAYLPVRPELLGVIAEDHFRKRPDPGLARHFAVEQEPHRQDGLEGTLDDVRPAFGVAGANEISEAPELAADADAELCPTRGRQGNGPPLDAASMAIKQQAMDLHHPVDTFVIGRL